MTTTAQTLGSVTHIPVRGPSRRHLSARGRAAIAGLTFIVPGFALYALIIGYPAVQALLISLRDYKITPGAVSPWIGLDNYVRAFHDPVLGRAFVNAAVYMVATVPTQILIGLGLAVLLDTALPGRTLFRVLFYLPVVTSWVIVSLLFQYLFATDHGVVNWFLVDVLHIVGHPVNWLGQHWTAMAAISALGVWKGVGWSMLIFLAALTGVPKELHEAAALDGAGAGRRFWHVSMPFLRGTVVTVLILLVIGGFNVFTSVLLMTNGGPLDQTHIFATWAFQVGIQSSDIPLGASVSLFMVPILAVAAIFILRDVSKRGNEA
jgi:multiple sugar transport system permease protein